MVRETQCPRNDASDLRKQYLERGTRFELATACLEGRSSTTELPPLASSFHLQTITDFRLDAQCVGLPPAGTRSLMPWPGSAALRLPAMERLA